MSETRGAYRYSTSPWPRGCLGRRRPGGGAGEPEDRRAHRRDRPADSDLYLRVGPVALPRDRARRPHGHGSRVHGRVEEIGSDVKNVEVGDFIVGSFVISDNTCEICRSGSQSDCVHREFVAQTVGTRAEKARIPHADGTLVATPEQPAPELLPSLLAASDALGTGWYGAVAAEAGPGKTVAVVAPPRVISFSASTGGTVRASSRIPNTSPPTTAAASPMAAKARYAHKVAACPISQPSRTRRSNSFHPVEHKTRENVQACGTLGYRPGPRSTRRPPSRTSRSPGRRARPDPRTALDRPAGQWACQETVLRTSRLPHEAAHRSALSAPWGCARRTAPG
ncbi:alcohol dehydrogenase catalytic domain-containing protein [Streptomyces sp. NPDC060048]|uniref:alcohol dehydrogenase catalytic domain-containing protein n=1 Tax=unclassified Streptomyces TaxID=2593676 RepID=UPI0036CF5641